jgi:hypothetical protein
MRGGDLSLRPAGLEAKDCAQRAVGDRGQDAEEYARASGIASGRLNDAKGHHGTPIPGTPVGEHEPLPESVEAGEENPVAQRATVGHLKVE